MIILDTETTGLSTSSDQIIEICISVNDAVKVWRVRPTIAIPPAAAAVHGITDADVAHCPPFATVAPEIVTIVSAADVVVGFNLRFDLDILAAELARAGYQPLDLAGKQVVDVLRLWHHVEPRTLVAAHERFVGAPLDNAHAAAVDVAATGRVLEAMLDRFGLAGKAWPELAAIANPFTGREKWIGPTHHVQWHDSGHAVFAFGKNSGQRIDAVDPGFLRWVLGKDFPSHVKDICHLALHKRGDELVAELGRRYPRPTVATEAA